MMSEAQDVLVEKNLYTYCDNNSITRTDVNGGVWIGVAIAGLVGVSAISCAVSVTGLGKIVQTGVSVGQYTI